MSKLCELFYVEWLLMIYPGLCLGLSHDAKRQNSIQEWPDYCYVKVFCVVWMKTRVSVRCGSFNCYCISV